MMSFDNGINGEEIVRPRTVTDGGESLQDDSYSFDEENTDNEEYHDSQDAETGELDFELDEDRMNEERPESDLH
jgi:hypothetical protein